MYQCAFGAARGLACALFMATCLAIPLPAEKHKASMSTPMVWTDCGGGATTLTVNNVILKPDPVETGKNFTLSLDCTSDEQITAGTFVTEVYLAGVPVHKESDDICSKTACPIPAGKALIKSVNFMPGITPYGRYRIVVTGLLPDGLPDICAEIYFDVGTAARARLPSP